MSEKKDKEHYPPKQGRKMLSLLEEVTDLLKYYMGDTDQFRTQVYKEKIQPIEDYIRQLSIHDNVKNINLAKEIRKELEEKLSGDE